MKKDLDILLERQLNAERQAARRLAFQEMAQELQLNRERSETIDESQVISSMMPKGVEPTRSIVKEERAAKKAYNN